MTILEDRTGCNRPLASRELHIKMNKALNEARRLRLRIRRLLAAAQGDAAAKS
jgi:hypothetical protein